MRNDASGFLRGDSGPVVVPHGTGGISPSLDLEWICLEPPFRLSRKSELRGT